MIKHASNVLPPAVVGKWSGYSEAILPGRKCPLCGAKYTYSDQHDVYKLCLALEHNKQDYFACGVCWNKKALCARPDQRLANNMELALEAEYSTDEEQLLEFCDEEDAPVENSIMLCSQHYVAS
ncbi:hypothetical protein NDU88_006215 [Pleurodeles waltl]|uniref:Uncharacterized protein n=1 Tax=Pleurodeles waltl TaxID=8319 RepID=A0AAV7TXU6_PLEWA|nr:hypothetical protein NDU88_006215 [Pleurodeles waltl]